MSTVSINLYDMFRKNLKLQDGEAREIVNAIEDVAKERSSDNMTFVNKDIQTLKEHFDIRFGTLDAKFATKEDLANTRVELIRWMFIFWIGQIAATFGFILLFLKK